jgi:hypothetical protein
MANDHKKERRKELCNLPYNRVIHLQKPMEEEDEEED